MVRYVAAMLETGTGLLTKAMNNFRMLGALASLGLSVLFPLLFPNPAVITIAVFALIFAGAATGWNVFSGYTGYISLGHAAFYGLGVYILALVCQVWNIPAGFPPLLLLPVVGLVTGMCSLPLGWIALKTRRETFMVITIAIFVLTAQLPNLLSRIFTSLSEITLPVPDWSGDIYNIPFYYAALALLLLALGVSYWVRHSKYGLSLFAIRDDEARAQGLGVQVGLCKLTAFVISAGFVGMAGALNAYFLGVVAPDSAFDHSLNIAIPLMAFLGGLGTLSGPIIGALVEVPMDQFLTLQYGAQGWDLILYGLLFLVVILLLPEGIAPALLRRWSAWSSSRREINIVETKPFASSDVVLAASWSAGSPAPREATTGDASYVQSPGSIIDSIPRSLSGLTTGKGLTQKVRAQRLVSFGQEASTPPPVMASLPPIEWFCPRCDEPLWTWEEILFCTRCGLTLSLAEKKSAGPGDRVYIDHGQS
jgi:branched-chain amino acid transport system permease protein